MKLGLTRCLLAAGGAAAVLTFAVAAANATPHGAGSATYQFQSIVNPSDPTFDQLLGVDDRGTIVGYYGSGADAKHPNKGFSLRLPSTSAFVAENYPGSVQTQVVAVSGNGNTAGFWIDSKGANHGFIAWNGVFTTVDDPLAGGQVKTTQVLGLNSKGVAVGFYNDAKGTPHAFKYNQETKTFTTLTPPNADSSVASGINNRDEISGFLTRGKTTAGFFVTHAHYYEFDAPGSTNTQPLGLNLADEVVGSFVDAKGLTHGFVLTNPATHASFVTVDDPSGVGNTLINGVDDKGRLVGFYTDTSKRTIGFLATP